MDVFLVPCVLCKEIDSVLSNFWWGHNQDSRKLHWRSWNELGVSKTEGEWAFALLAKQFWRLATEPDSYWAKLLKSRYYPHCTILEACKGSRASSAWSSILDGREIILK
ncbi:hypothetical protein GBA52_029047 [Prunus armeniaca]|nr:hypothetical protein GBA52_029047 [Prunus armeniaca]